MKRDMGGDRGITRVGRSEHYRKALALVEIGGAEGSVPQ